MDFFGTTTPADIMASVTTGVQDTGADLWPILTMLGIGLAFVIGGYIIDFIRNSVGAKKSSRYEETYTPDQLERISNKIVEIEKRPGAGYP